MSKDAVSKAGGTLLCFLLLVLSSCRDNDRSLEKTSYRYDSVSAELKRQKAISDSLRGILQNGKETEDFNIYFGREFEDIANPEEFISSELQENSGLIPLDPVLGGTMEFRRIQVLSEDWVYTEYDDGHIKGSAIYRYRLQPGGDLSFELVASHQPK